MSYINIQIAKHLGYEASSDLEYVREWVHVYFVKPVAGRCTFVSKAIINKVAKPVIKAAKKVIKPILRSKDHEVIQLPMTPDDTGLYRVVRTWDNGSSYLGDRVISVLIQDVEGNSKEFWDNSLMAQGFKRGDILEYNSNSLLIKSQQTYAQAIGLHA